MDTSRGLPRRARPVLGSWPERSVLGSLAPPAREALLALGMPREYAAGGRLMMEGDAGTEAMLLIDGWVKVMGVTEDGGLALLDLRTGGDIVGEQSSLEGQPRSATVVSAGATLVHVIGQREFLAFLAAWPEVSLAVSRALSAKLRWATRRRIDFSGLPVRVRVARVLSDLVRLDGRPGRDGIELGYTLTQPELAAMVGASEPSVHKALRQLRVSGVILTGYRRLVISDLDSLAALAEPG